MRPPYSRIRSGVPNPVVLGRKFCPTCGRWRFAHEFWFASGKLGTYCSACGRRRNQVAYARRSSRQREARREYQRIWLDAKRRQAGIPKRNFRNRQWIGEPDGGGVRLEPAPIVRALEDYMRRQRTNGHPDWTWSDLAEAVGTSERALLRYRTGESAHITLDAADRISIALGVRLDELYPFEEGAV